MMNAIIKKVGLGLCVSFFSALVVSCVSAQRFDRLDRNFTSGNYTEARSLLEADKKILYPPADILLYYLDAGMLSRFAGKYQESNNELAEAEKLIESYYAKSVSQAVGSFLLNDTLIDYAGEDYEDIYANLFMALNYIQLDKTEDAFVEIRRFDNKIKLLSSKYEQAIYEAQQRIGGKSDSDQPDLQFHNSAFARYISMLLYRAEGKTDSARIDKKYIEAAFSAQPALYTFALPAAVEEEVSLPEGTARLNVLCFTGSSPIKEEEVLRVPDIGGGSWFKIALPVMHKRASKTVYAEVEAEDTNGVKTSCKLELLESIENIAEDTFRRKKALLYTKAVLRGVSKTAAASTAGAVLESSEDDNLKALGSLLNFVSGIFIEVSERADTRISRFFPAQVRVGGLNLASGLYTVRVSCYDNKHRLLHREIKENVQVKSGKINIVESVCTQ